MRPWAEEETRARSEVGCDSPTTGVVFLRPRLTRGGAAPPPPLRRLREGAPPPPTHCAVVSHAEGAASAGPPGCAPGRACSPRHGSGEDRSRSSAGAQQERRLVSVSSGGSREPCPRRQAASTPVALTPRSEPCLSVAASQNTIHFVAQLKPDSGRPENPGVRGGGPRGPRPPGRRGWLLPGSCSPRARRGSEAAMFDRAALP